MKKKCMRCQREVESTNCHDVCYRCVGFLRVPSLPNDLRERGWKVATHNDYHTSAGDYTFYLLTKPLVQAPAVGVWEGDVTVAFIAVKGEGQSDAAALDEARDAAKRADEFIKESKTTATKLREMDRTHMAVCDELSDRIGELDKMKARYTDLEARYGALTTSYRILSESNEHAAVQRLNLELAQVKAQRDELQKRFDAVVPELQTLRQQFTDLKQESVDLREKALACLRTFAGEAE